MKKNLTTYLLWAIFAFLLAYGCSGITNFPHAIVSPDALKSYMRDIEDKMLRADWERAYQTALQDSLSVKLPYGEKGSFLTDMSVAYSYNVGLEQGEMLVAEVAQTNPSQKIFIEILERDGDSFRSVAESGTGQSRLAVSGESSGIFKVVIQPQAGAAGDFFISLNKKPLYAFPVSGKGNASVQSFWGAVRDGGKRSHEGVDIFARKGTPVVAVADGVIARTGEFGIGGKQVWLRTGIFGKSVYYAHLDGIAVEDGIRVKTGDTLGFVGNTGNAKGGAHHLHFGIYGGSGAVNPLPFIFRTPDISQKQYSRKFDTSRLKIRTAQGTLRKGPSTDYAKIGHTVSGQTVTLLGQHNSWLHVKTDDGRKAFLHASLVKA